MKGFLRTFHCYEEEQVTVSAVTCSFQLNKLDRVTGDFIYYCMINPLCVYKGDTMIHTLGQGDGWMISEMI